MNLVKAVFNLRNFLWRLKLRLVIRALKFWACHVSMSKKGLLALVFFIFLAGIVAGQAWRIAQVEPQHRQDVLYLLRYIRDTHIEINALKTRLADAEARQVRVVRGK